MVEGSRVPLLRINATATGLALHESTHLARFRLCRMAARPGPAIIMVHGYKYAPGSADHCPHRKIFGGTPQGWPAGLGFGQGDRQEGLCIALGWYARGPLRKVHRRAAQLGESLSTVVAMLREHRPERPVHVIAHSLGSEAALSALHYLPAKAIDRMILLTGASYKSHAEAMLATPAGRSAEVLNVLSRENDLFDAVFERLVTSSQGDNCAIGQGIEAPNALNLQIDCPETLSALASLGFPVAPPMRRVCHWSAYKRPGIMEVYNRFLRSPDMTSLATIRALLPQCPSPRWSRLFTPLAQKGLGRDNDLPPWRHALPSARGRPRVNAAPGSTNEPAY
jgi:pimeloyl-ACP methyl ester carboxylesterase